MTKPLLADALKSSDLLFSRAQLESAIRRMAVKIDAAYSGSQQAPVFLTVMNGGLMVSGQLALACTTDFHFDYIHATRYRSTTQGAQLEWISRPRTSIAGREVLIVDDILDEGRTIGPIRDWCFVQGATKVAIAVLCEKQHDRRISGMVADFIGVSVPDRYVYGFGMDYHEQGRNLNSIYALREAK